MEKVSNFFTWLFSLNISEKAEADPAKKLLNSMRLTSKCRFNASIRLERLSTYSFLTTTILSLGLIFIPLYQKSGLPIPYTEPVIHMLQIFLAVAVLVYSVVNATSKYHTRSSKLDDCGIKIKELIRKLRVDIAKETKEGTNIDLDNYHQEYHLISSEPENHRRVDYILATLESKEDFDISGIPRSLLYTKAFILYSIPYILPTMMMAFEIAIISDILGVTDVLKDTFGNTTENLLTPNHQGENQA
ncbi:SLATT domain-containing protein [Microbulbifer sp. PAAF003]|uniref:SLATT domain-containing protein n=1 Tax=Microbulbifer sp. PAAF003 TaxID=3243375 RepID=UPI00403A62D1